MTLKKDRRARISTAFILTSLLLVGLLQLTATPASALISESFEGGWGDWTWDYNYDLAYFGGSISSVTAYDGIRSVKLDIHGLPSPPYPMMSAWIERSVQVPPSTTMNVGVDFWLVGNGTAAPPREILAFLGAYNPGDYSDFTVIGLTEQSLSWYHYSYSTSITTGVSGLMYAAVGFHNEIVGFKTYFFDLVNLTGVSIDFNPPVISNLRPVDTSLTSDNTPLIAADYTDDTGIDTSSVILRVDLIDVTASSTVTNSSVQYTPVTPLIEGIHRVVLEVRDISVNRNKATAFWNFTIDSLPPTITNKLPMNLTTIDETTPYVGANYIDVSGVNTSSVVLKVDSIDVTSSSAVMPTYVGYTPLTPMAEGQHNVYLEVWDNSIPPNKAKVTWSFTIDSLPPVITDLRPVPSSFVATARPQIRANYTDASGIDTSSVILTVDMVNVTSTSFVTPFDVLYTPPSYLSEGLHSVILEVKDASPAHKIAIASWQFTVDTEPPVIANKKPLNNSIIGITTPEISASYSDPSGINLNSVVLEVDSINVTSSSIVTTSAVKYTPLTPLDDGWHDVSLSVRDDSTNHNLATATWTFRVDSNPPVTSLSTGFPHFNDTVNSKTFVSSSTPISLVADDSDGIGVESIWYLYHASIEPEPSYRQYTSSFYIPNTKNDGLILVKFYSVDTFNNEETPQTIELYLDNTPPVSSVPGWDFSNVTYTNNALASVTVQGDDGFGAGVGPIKFGVDNEACPDDYVSPIVIGDAGEGLHTISFLLTDRVGNVGTLRQLQVFLDTTPPTADAGDSATRTPNAIVNFDGSASSDNIGGSGIANYTWTFTYRGSLITLYGVSPTFIFTDKGSYEVTLRVTDRAGNSDTDATFVNIEDAGAGGASTLDFPWWAIVIIIVAALVPILLWALMRKKREEKPGEEEVEISCPSCGKKLTAEDEFCSKCGTRLKQEEG